jgi:LacI family transcriptional regulator
MDQDNNEADPCYFSDQYYNEVKPKRFGFILMSISIHDVAKRLNLSITTVSRALDGYDDVSEETRQRVIQMAREMGYVPSRAARQLRRQQAEAIGYILPTTTPRFTDPYFSQFIAGLGDEIAGSNYDLVISTAPPGDAAEEALYRNWVQGRRVDGVVLARIRQHDWRVRFLADNGLPFVATAHNLDPVQFPYIELDGRSGTAAIVQHLVDGGHRAIAFIGADAELVVQSERYAGYQLGLESAGIDYRSDLVTAGDMTRRGGYQAVQSLLDLAKPPTAVVCVNDLTAEGVMRAASERGLKVGRDLAVTGFDGIDDPESVEPALTTCGPTVYEIARRLMAMLQLLVTGKPLKEPYQLLQPELMIRESSSGKE